MILVDINIAVVTVPLFIHLNQHVKLFAGTRFTIIFRALQDAKLTSFKGKPAAPRRVRGPREGRVGLRKGDCSGGAVEPEEWQ